MKKILVVDDMSDIREILSLMLESSFEVEILEASSGNQAIRVLRENPSIDAVICDYQMSDGNGEDVYRFMLQSGLKIPFLMCSSNVPADFEFFRKNPPFSFIIKPAHFAAITEVMKPIFEAGLVATPEYVKIRMSTVLRHGLLACDLYVKASERKYIKVMREGDVFEAADFAKFEAKQIDYLYSRASDSKQILDRMLAGLNRLTKEKPNPTVQQGIYISTAALEVISDFTRSLGFTPEVQKLTEQNIQLAIQTIRSTREFSQLYAKLMIDPDNFLASHSTVLAYLSCGLASLMKWNSDQTFYKLSIAAFLHDLTLTDELSKLESLSELELSGGDFTVQEKETFSVHPTEAAHLAHTLGEHAGDIHTIIFQHHERPDGKGFPQGINHEHIQPLSAVFIVAEGIISFRQKVSTEDSLIHYLSSLDPSFKRGAFRGVIEAIFHAVSQAENG
jgi:response regulator RpfG family c-di-GMP phosphodiesterase